MYSKAERFLTFIMKERTRNFFAGVFYTLFIVISSGINLPLVVDIPCLVALIFIMLDGCTVYMCDWTVKMYERNRGKLGKNIIREIKKIAKELLMFIPIWLISICVTYFISIGKTENQASIDANFHEAPILTSIISIIIGPIMEEFIFRFLPYRFIKNKILYIIVSTVVFAALHVINDPNPFYNIWFYMMRAWYYAYRYHKTKDLLVPLSLHSWNNLVGTIQRLLK